MLTDRCGLLHTGSKRSVPAMSLLGEATLKSYDIVSHLYGNALSTFKGHASAYSSGGEVNILGNTEQLASFTLSYFWLLKALYSPPDYCGCVWGPFFTANKDATQSQYNDVGLLHHPYSDGYYIWNSNNNCQNQGLFPALTQKLPSSNKWIHVTVVYDKAMGSLTNYVNGEYHSTIIIPPMTRCLKNMYASISIILGVVTIKLCIQLTNFL